MGFFQTVYFEANSALVLSPTLQNSPDDRGICSRTFVVTRDNNYLSVIVEEAEQSSNTSVASTARLSTPARSESAARLSTPARAAAGSKRAFTIKMTISPRAKNAYCALTSSSTGSQPTSSNCLLEVATASATAASQRGELITEKEQLPPIQLSSHEAEVTEAESSCGERVEDIFLAPVVVVRTLLKPDVAVKKQASVTPSRRKWRSIAKSVRKSGES